MGLDRSYALYINTYQSVLPTPLRPDDLVLYLFFISRSIINLTLGEKTPVIDLCHTIDIDAVQMMSHSSDRHYGDHLVISISLVISIRIIFFIFHSITLALLCNFNMNEHTNLEFRFDYNHVVSAACYLNRPVELSCAVWPGLNT